MDLIFKTFARLPLWLIHSLGWILGWIVFICSPIYRRRLIENSKSAGFVGCVWGSIGSAGKLVAELPRLWLGKPVPIFWEGDDCVRDALNLKKGIIFLTPHLGCFEITAQAYSECFGQADQPLTVLYRPARKLWLNDLMIKSRQRVGLHTAPTNMGGVKQMIKALRLGQSVGLLPDQVPPLGMGEWVEFLGRKAYTMTLALRLAQQTGATVIVAWGERLPWGQGYRIHCKKLSIPLSPSFQISLRYVNSAIEDLIIASPDQYLWGYARYQNPRKGRI